MILSDKTILKMLKDHSLKIFPVEKEQIQPASVDIRLGDTFSIVEDSSKGIITMQDEIPYKVIKSDSYVLLPHQFVLATTMEYIELPEMCIRDRAGGRTRGYLWRAHVFVLGPSGQESVPCNRAFCCVCKTCMGAHRLSGAAEKNAEWLSMPIAEK